MALPALAALLPPLLLLLLMRPAGLEAGAHSRHKRYLVFPEGSSLQLVYELAVPPPGRSRTFVLSYTAGTAWELPGDARDIIDKVKPLRVRTEPPPPPPSTSPPDHHFLYHDWDYHDHLAMKPPAPPGDPGRKGGAGSKVFYGPYTQKSPYKQKEYYYMDYPGYSRPEEVRLHRQHRRSALLKLEPLLLTVGLGGRACVLRALCEAGQRPAGAPKHAFLAELLHALFTLPADPEEAAGEAAAGAHSDVLRHYDAAHAAAGACHALYPACGASLLERWAPPGGR